MKLLFTCMGTSDPVRGYHDGPMLHIIRHYRPDVICVLLSSEAAALNDCGARLDTVLAHIRKNWGGYAPETMPVWIYSLGYNGSYMIPEIILTTLAATLLFPVLDKTLKPAAQNKRLTILYESSAFFMISRSHTAE